MHHYSINVSLTKIQTRRKSSVTQVASIKLDKQKLGKKIPSTEYSKHYV